MMAGSCGSNASAGSGQQITCHYCFNLNLDPSAAQPPGFGGQFNQQQQCPQQNNYGGPVDNGNDDFNAYEFLQQFTPKNYLTSANGYLDNGMPSASGNYGCGNSVMPPPVNIRFGNPVSGGNYMQSGQGTPSLASSGQFCPQQNCPQNNYPSGASGELQFCPQQSPLLNCPSTANNGQLCPQQCSQQNYPTAASGRLGALPQCYQQSQQGCGDNRLTSGPGELGCSPYGNSEPPPRNNRRNRKCYEPDRISGVPDVQLYLCRETRMKGSEPCKPKPPKKPCPVKQNGPPRPITGRCMNEYTNQGKGNQAITICPAYFKPCYGFGDMNELNNFFNPPKNSEPAPKNKPADKEPPKKVRNTRGRRGGKNKNDSQSGNCPDDNWVKICTFVPAGPGVKGKGKKGQKDEPEANIRPKWRK